MIADAAEPPFVPNQDINAASQSAIGSFNDENQYRKVKTCIERVEDAAHTWSSRGGLNMPEPIPTTNNPYFEAGIRSLYHG